MFDLPSLREIIISVPPFLLALSFHEFAHAWAADKMGDPTPRNAGRLTLNPLAHLDILGTILLILYSFGWAKPVPVNPLNFHNIRRGEFLVSIAGPASNILLACIGMALLSLTYRFGLSFVPEALLDMTGLFVWINIILAVFNMIPLPPLDGSHVLESLLPSKYSLFFDKIAVYGPVILMVLVFTNVFRYVIIPIASFVFLVLGRIFFLPK